MQPVNDKPQTTLRAILLRYIPLVAVLMIDLFFLAFLDAMFVAKKRVVILESRSEFDSMLDDITPLKDALGNIYPLKPNSENIVRYVNQAQKILSTRAGKLLEGDHPWFRIVLTDENNQIVADYHNEKKIRQFNTWKNCLFSRSFHSSVGNVAIRLTVYYTTPRGWPEIEIMVPLYRSYALLFVLVTWIVYWWLNRRVFRPLRRVGSAIEHTIHSENVSLIDRPRQDIEFAFNRLARNQREVYFGLDVDRLVDSLHNLSDDAEVLRRFLTESAKITHRIYSYNAVEVYSFDTEENQFQPLIDPRDTDSLSLPPHAGDERIFFENDSCTVIPLCVGDRVVGAFRCSADPELTIPADEISLMAHEVKKQAENGLARAVTRSRALTEERNRFGINLATNMGHDLTNIIASGKWDLDTIQRAHGLGIVTMDEKKGNYFLDAADSLHSNLQFLQEMVDIYRAFGYIRHPRYERTDLNALLQGVTKLFRLSTSQNLSTEVLFTKEIEVTAEPRLLRMALFNLLVNASHAIQSSEEVIRSGVIQVTVQECPNDRVSIHVIDNGPGIRNKDKNLMQEPEIDYIFQSGYSTKDGGSGGGLGLSWVKSIIEDYHAGTIRASNRPEGGARISLTLPRNLEPS